MKRLFALLLAIILITGCRAKSTESSAQPDKTKRPTASPSAVTSPSAEPTDAPDHGFSYETDRHNVITGWDAIWQEAGGLSAVLYDYDSLECILVNMRGETQSPIQRPTSYSFPSLGKLSPFAGENGKDGYADYTGTFILPPIYDSAGNFSAAGYAVINNYSIGESFLINESGTRVSDIYDSISDWDNCYVAYTGETQLLLDEHGQVLLSGLGSVSYTGYMEESTFIIQRNRLYGIYSVAEKRMLVEPVYRFITTDSDLGLYFIEREDRSAFLCDPVTFSEIRAYSMGALNDYQHISGDLFIPAGVEYSEERFLLNANGTQILHGNLSSLGANHVLLREDGYADVYRRDGTFLRRFEGSNLWCYWQSVDRHYRALTISNSNTFIFNTQTENWTELAGENTYEYGDYIYVGGGESILRMNKETQQVTKLASHRVQYFFEPGDSTRYYSFYENGHVGLADMDGNVILDPLYDDISVRTHGLLIASLGCKSHYFFEKNAEVIAPKQFAATSQRDVFDISVPTYYIMPDTSRVVVDGKTYEIYETATINGEPYVPFYGLPHTVMPFRPNYNYRVNLGGISIAFRYGETNVDLYVYNITSGRFDKQTIETGHVSYVNEYDSAYPLRVVASLLDLPYSQDASGMITFGGADIRLAVADGAALFKTTPRQSALSAAQKQKILAQLQFASATLPEIDGSTSALPFMQSLYAQLRQIDITQATEKIYNTKTHNAYMRLQYEENLVIFVVPPSAEEAAHFVENDMELNYTQFAKEGFVFFTHTDNPVDNLTTAQLKAIYQGEITNWKEVGGRDEPIIAYQRETNSGSQALMDTLFMKGEPMMKTSLTRKVETMGGMIDIVLEYQNAGNAIGYSVQYFANTMYSPDEIKMLAVDGVYPSNENIANGTYPYVTAYYAVTHKSAAPDSPQQKLIDFVTSDEGQALVLESGLVPLR